MVVKENNKIFFMSKVEKVSHHSQKERKMY